MRVFLLFFIFIYIYFIFLLALGRVSFSFFFLPFVAPRSWLVFVVPYARQSRVGHARLEIRIAVRCGPPPPPPSRAHGALVKSFFAVLTDNLALLPSPASFYFCSLSHFFSFRLFFIYFFPSPWRLYCCCCCCRCRRARRSVPENLMRSNGFRKDSLSRRSYVIAAAAAATRTFSLRARLYVGSTVNATRCRPRAAARRRVTARYPIKIKLTVSLQLLQTNTVRRNPLVFSTSFTLVRFVFAKFVSHVS